tara:strand:- start:313 stop:519 length:207 start_codon:yes stop_codon:yes gene_type:complete
MDNKIGFTAVILLAIVIIIYSYLSTDTQSTIHSTDKELYWEDNDTIIKIQKHYPTGDTIIDTIIRYNN